MKRMGRYLRRRISDAQKDASMNRLISDEDTWTRFFSTRDV